MIKKAVTIIYRDEKEETFSCVEVPYIVAGWYHLPTDKGVMQVIPMEGIKRIKIKDTWSSRSTTKKSS